MFKLALYGGVLVKFVDGLGGGVLVTGREGGGPGLDKLLFLGGALREASN